MSILAENLRTIRKERDCTQSQFAEILGIGFRTYVRYEVGERDAPISTLVKIAMLGNLSLQKLLTEKITLQDFCPLAVIAPYEGAQIDCVDFQTNLLYLKNYPMPVSIAFDITEKKFLSLFRRLNPNLQDLFSKNLGTADWISNLQNKHSGKADKNKISKLRSEKPSSAPKKRGRKKLDPKALQKKIEKLKTIAQSANKTTVR